jgi:hypothetical protein
LLLLEVFASVLCVILGNYIAKRLKTMNNPVPNPANVAPRDGRREERTALTQALIVLFVIAPAVYYASIYARGQVMPDPHKLISSASGKVSVDKTPGYLSPHAKSVDSHGELVIVEDVSEEEYQRSKSGDATKGKPNPKPSASKTTAVVAADFQKGQEVAVYTVMKDLGKMPFLIFCCFGIVFSAVSTLLLGNVIGV